MADRIKGITVEIGGDTTDLSASLKEINQESRTIGKELSDVQRLLKFNPENTELLAQRQELLNRQIANTQERLEHLRSVEHQVQQQFERGDLGADQLRAFQRELIATEGRLQHFERQAAGTQRNVGAGFKELGKGMAAGIGAAVAGMGINEVVSKALETAHMETKIRVGFEIPEEAVGKVKALIGTIQAYGVEGETAMEGVRKQLALNLDKTDEQNAAIIKGAAAISQAYGDIDFNELIQESNEMAGSLGMTQEEALGMTNTLLKMGFPPDQLDIISEYGTQLQRAGYDASQIQGIFAAGIETKSWNIDNLLDGVKEGRIRLAEFGISVDKTTAGLIKGTSISTTQLQKWGAAVSEGGEAGKVAIGEAAVQLGKIDDASKRNAIGVRLFGTMWEDQGKKITETLMQSDKYAGDATVNAANLKNTVNGISSDPSVKLNEALQNMNTALTPLLTGVANFVAKIAEWAAKNPELTAGIVAVTVGVGILIGLITAMAGVFGILTAAAGAAEIALLPFTLILLGIVAAIAAVVAAVYLIVTNWDWLKKKALEVGATIKKAWNDWVAGVRERMSKSVSDVKELWGRVMAFFRGINLKDIGHDIMQGFLNGISSMASKIWNKAKEIADGVGKWLKKALRVGSPSKVTMEIGSDTGAGFVIGLEKSLKEVAATSYRFNDTIQASLKAFQGDDFFKGLDAYFSHIQWSGDWMNDNLGAVPKQMQGLALAMGKMLTPAIYDPNSAIAKSKEPPKHFTVNITSPKALDVREANRTFNQTLNKMALMW